ncbi:MAG: hypothetical protein EP298_06315 [Gammaproteobacteria bacterium]|nr:MAG: hypothetical protein EP298_06315 [Gammaproteobacteria bacterium]UTW43265.1 hypothetical protein KFE69_03735 [bacterium SCSIO 12844]
MPIKYNEAEVINLEHLKDQDNWRTDGLKLYAKSNEDKIQLSHEAVGDYTEVESGLTQIKDVGDENRKYQDALYNFLVEKLDEKDNQSKKLSEVGWVKTFIDAYEQKLQAENNEKLESIEDITKVKNTLFFSNKSRIFCIADQKPEGFEESLYSEDEQSDFEEQFLYNLLISEGQVKTFYQAIEAEKQIWHKSFRDLYIAKQYVEGKEIKDLKIFYDPKKADDIAIGEAKGEAKQKHDLSQIKDGKELYININDATRKRLAELIEKTKHDTRPQWQTDFLEFHNNYTKFTSISFDSSEVFKDTNKFKNFNDLKTKMGKAVESTGLKSKNVTGYKNGQGGDTQDVADLEKFKITSSSKKVDIEVTKDKIIDKSLNELSEKTADTMAAVAKTMVNEGSNIYIHANTEKEYQRMFTSFHKQGFKKEQIQYAYIDDTKANSPSYKLFKDSLNKFYPRDKEVRNQPIQSNPQHLFWDQWHQVKEQQPAPKMPGMG